MKKLLKLLGIAAIIGLVVKKLKGGSCSSCEGDTCSTTNEES